WMIDDLMCSERTASATRPSSGIATAVSTNHTAHRITSLFQRGFCGSIASKFALEFFQNRGPVHALKTLAAPEAKAADFHAFTHDPHFRQLLDDLEGIYKILWRQT